MSEPAPSEAPSSRLWSIQREGAYLEFLRTGVLRANADHIDPDFVLAYEWMATQLEKKTPKPPAFLGAYPVWAWLQYTGQDKPRPNPRDPGLLPTGAKGVLLELAVPASSFLASDFQKWHAVLNHDFLPEDTKERRAFDSWVENSRHHNNADALIESRIEASWHRIFDVDKAGSDCWEAPEDREIQVVLWQIDRKDVMSAQRFIAV